MTATTEVTRRVIIGGREYDKPWDPQCAACRSPWLQHIDSALAEGYSIRKVRELLAGRRPAVPNDTVLRAHIQHLAGPHLKARLAVEEAAEARGDDTTSVSARMEDALAAIVREGTERLVHGELEVGAKDMIAAMRLIQQMERAREGDGVGANAWQAAFMAFFEIAQKHLTRPQWKAFVEDIYASPDIRAVLAEPAGELTGGAR